MSDIRQLTNSRTVNLDQTVENETKSKIEYDKKIRLDQIKDKRKYGKR